MRNGGRDGRDTKPLIRTQLQAKSTAPRPLAFLRVPLMGIRVCDKSTNHLDHPAKAPLPTGQANAWMANWLYTSDKVYLPAKHNNRPSVSAR
jgi:hypothetical protein